LRIVHVGVPYMSETLSGVERVVGIYTEYQARAGHEVTLIDYGRERPSGETWLGDPPVRQLILRTPLASLDAGPAGADLFRRNRLRADVFHFHSSFPRHNRIASLLPVPYIVSPHGAQLPEEMAQKNVLRRTAFRLLLDRRFLRQAAFVHAVCETERQAIGAYAPDARVEVIPHPVRPSPPVLDPERRAARRQLGLGEDDVCLLFLGRLLVQCKGLDLLVGGFALAARDTPRLRLVIAGPESGGARLRVPEAVRTLVTRFGPAFGAEKRRLLAAADAFATLSRWDTMPTAVMEALAAGLPVLVTEATGLAAFVREAGAGSVVAPAYREVAEAIAALRPPAEGERRRIAAAAREAFDPARAAARMLSLYERALAGGDLKKTAASGGSETFSE
jgi:glycosyltransferase involved in cell wall biosynthesis